MDENSPPESTSDKRPPHRLAPLTNTTGANATSARKKRRKNPNKSSSKSTSAENFRASPSQQHDRNIEQEEPSRKGLLTANMLEKLKERLQSEDIKPLVSSDSSSYGNSVKTMSTVTTSMPRTETGTELLSTGPVSGRGLTGNAGESSRAWHEPEPMAITTDEDQVEPFGDHPPDSRSSSPRAPTLESHDLQQPTISQTTYVKHRSDPTVTASSKQTHLTSSHRHHSQGQTIEQEQLEAIEELTESQAKLPKFYRGPDETDNPVSPPGRSLPDLPADTDIMEMRERAPDQVVPMEHISEPQNPWQMLTGTDVVEKMGPGVSELREMQVPPITTAMRGYQDPSQHRRRSIEANIFTERRDGRGFMRKTSYVDRSYGARLYASVSTQITGAQYALFLYSFTQHLSITVHGLITGLSLWHSVVVNYIGRSFSHLNVLQYFHQFALPLHTIHYFCLAIVLLSLLDRLDVGNISLVYVKSFLRSSSQFLLLVVAVLVLVCLVITLLLGAHEEQMALFATHPALWSDLLTAVNRTSAVGINALTSPTLQYPSHLDANVVYIPARSPANSAVVNEYMGLLLARAVCCLVSWIAVVFTGDFDRLKDQIVYDSRSRRVSRTSFQLPATTMNYVGT